MLGRQMLLEGLTFLCRVKQESKKRDAKCRQAAKLWSCFCSSQSLKKEVNAFQQKCYIPA